MRNRILIIGLLALLAALLASPAQAMTADQYYADGNRLARDDLYWAALLRYGQAAEQGLGVVTAALPLTSNWLERSHLVPAFEQRVKIPDRYFVLYRKGDEVRPNVQQFLTWISSEFATPPR